MRRLVKFPTCPAHARCGPRPKQAAQAASLCKVSQTWPKKHPPLTLAAYATGCVPRNARLFCQKDKLEAPVPRHGHRSPTRRRDPPLFPSLRPWTFHFRPAGMGFATEAQRAQRQRAGEEGLLVAVRRSAAAQPSSLPAAGTRHGTPLRLCGFALDPPLFPSLGHSVLAIGYSPTRRAAARGPPPLLTNQHPPPLLLEAGDTKRE